MAIPVLINNNASRNKSGRLQKKDNRLFADPSYKVVVTGSHQEMRSRLKEILKTRPKVLIVKGGDGTMHYVLNVLSEYFGHTRKTWPITLVPIPGGATNATAGCVVKPGFFGSVLFRLLSGNRDRIPEEFDLPLLRMKIQTSNGKKQEIVATIVHVAGLFNRFYRLFFSRQGSAWQNVTKAFRLAFKQVKKDAKQKSFDADEDALFEPFPVVVKVNGKPLGYDRYSILNVSSISARIYYFLRFFVQIPKDQIRLVAGIVLPMEIFRNVPRVLTARLMRGNTAAESDATVIRVSTVGNNYLAPVIDGEIYENVRNIEFKVGPKVRMISFRRFKSLVHEA